MDSATPQPPLACVRPISPSLRLVVGLLSLATMCSALALAAASVALTQKPAWMVFGFELCAVAAGWIGVQVSRRRYENGQGLALLCIAGTIGAGAFLWWFSLNPRGSFQLASSGVERKSVSLTPLVYARLGIAGLLTLIASWTVLQRNTRSWWYIGRAAMFGGPVLLAAVALKKFSGPVSSMLDVIPSAAKAGIYGIVGIAVISALSISIHCLIRAFELGQTASENDASAALTPSGQATSTSHG